ncbi:MAG: PilW family protein [Rhizobacter sp.]
MKTLPLTYAPGAARAFKQTGFTLVEMMIALGLGLVLIVSMTSVYLSSKTASRRLDQLSTVQQNVRIAFEYLSDDARGAGMRGCQTGGTAANFVNPLAAGLTTNYGTGVEGYNAVAAPSYPLTDVNTASSWTTNTAASGGANTIPVGTIAGTAGTMTPGSDVLVLRVAGKAVRLSASTTSGAAALNIENVSSGKCYSPTTTDRVSGFCASSHGLIASCSNARVFTVATTATSPGGKLNFTTGITLGGDPIYASGTAEVFPLQTIVYYVKASSNGSGNSLYRHVFDGNGDDDQELIEGVETMQVTYGIDSSSPPNGAIDSYVTASGLTGDWATVGAVRVSLLVRGLDPVGADVAVPATAVVNGTTVTFPTSGAKYDRRVFTTTIALRNKISF